MVFGDYELIHTKRVNRERMGTNVYLNRYFKALGGFNTLYFATVSFSLGMLLRSQSKSLIFN